MNPADGPPVDFADVTEPMFVLLETSHGSGNYEVTDYLGSMWETKTVANGQARTARLSVNLGYNPRFVEPDATLPLDWQVEEYDGTIANAWDVLLTGRRVMITTLRNNPADDWLRFYGMINKVEPGYSGTSKGKARWATTYAASIAEHGDSEPGQTLIGQWRRSRRGELARRGQGEGDSDECVLVPAATVIFNPGGKPNCCKYPLELTGSTGTELVYVFTDVDAPDAEHWTVARMLRYIEWAAMQPPPPMSGELYDVEHFSDPLWGPTQLQELGRWTTYGFLHDNLDELIEELLPIVYAVGSTPRERVLLRTLADMAPDHFSTQEAFVLVAERAGLAYYERHWFTDAGDARTSFVWTIRGDHTGQSVGRPGGRPEHQPGEPEPAPPPAPPPGPPPSAPGVYLYVPHDRYSVGAQEYHELVRAENTTEGAVVLDESPIRNEIRVQGDADQFEGTWELKPGWQPDDWLDVDPDDEDAVAEAKARIETPEFQARYKLDKMSGAARVEHGHKLRRWVLNEHGYYTPDDYQRAAGPFSSAATYLPYGFRTQGNLCTLAVRGDNGCCLRRRRFLPTIGQWWNEGAVDPVQLGVMAEISFDSGATWELLIPKADSEANECAITISADDLTAFKSGAYPDRDFVRAYIEGRLRVRVLANIDSDDAVVAVAGWRPESPLDFIVTDHVSRRGQFRRQLRYAPGGGLAANSVLPGYGVLLPLNVDDGPEAERLATRLRNELEGRRVSGRVTLPYLLREGAGPWEGYCIGDEVLGIITQDEGTFVPMRASADASKPGARIVGITHTYRDEPSERSTTLHIEDPGFEDTEYLPGDPRPRPPLGVFDALAMAGFGVGE